MPNTEQVLKEAIQLHQTGRFMEASIAYLRVLETEPDQSLIYSQVGQALFALSRPADAERVFELAADRFPDDTPALHNLGSCYALQKKYDKAEEAYGRAAAVDPNDGETQSSLGVIFHKQERFADAETHFLRAIELAPENVLFYRRLSDAMSALSHHEEAIEPLTKGLKVDPGEIVLRFLLGCSLNKIGRHKDHIALIEDYVKNPRTLDNSLVQLVLDLFSNPELTVEDEGRLLPKIFGYLHGKAVSPDEPASVVKRKKISIGYITSFMHYANYMGFLGEIAASHNREDFTVKMYSDGLESQSGNTIDGTDEICPTKGLSNQELCEKIRQDGIDILVELNGFASIDRLEFLAMKPAPILVSWFNAFSTLGLDTVDYLIGDHIASPPEEDCHYDEAIYRLPGCYLIRNLDEEAPPVQKAPVSENGFCTFGSLAAGHKVHAGCVAAWSRILECVPDSRLILGNAVMNEHLSEFFRREFEKCGIDSARVDFIGPAGHAEFLRIYDRIDIALDSFPWNGGTTTVEALWQGVPVVCFNGDRWVSRVAATIVTAVNHPEWVGKNLDEYVRIATALADDQVSLQRIRAGLRDEMAASPLCDTAGFTKNLEAAYDEMARSKGIVA